MTNNIMTDHDLIDQSDQKPEFNTITWRDTTHFDSEDDYRAQVVETPVTVNNSLIQDFVHPGDHSQPTYEKKLLDSNLSQVTDSCKLCVFFMC